jgi:hypothetical protein
MNITDIKKQFSPSDQIIIKRFLAFVNENALNDSNFSDDASIDELNQFSEMADSDEDIKTSVRDWLHKKKVRLRGNFTNN